MIKTIASPDRIQKIAQQLGATTVSIDLFDTLVYRNVPKPSDIFRLNYRASRILSEYFTEAEWINLRVSSEKKKATQIAPAEVQLVDIYREISESSKLSWNTSEALMALELASERENIKPYREVVEVLKLLIVKKITVTVTTDTYLPESFIRSILDSFLDFKYQLLCSSSSGKTKRFGEAYLLLKAQSCSKNIVHFGDNSRVDVLAAQRQGVRAYLTQWDRQRWLQTNQRLIHYQTSLNSYCLSLPCDEVKSKDMLHYASTEVAWRWSITLFDFLLSAAAYANSIGATDVWFLSRDCEVMFAALEETSTLALFPNPKYVFCSRAACYPLVAGSDPARFQKWTGRQATASDLTLGETATRYYKGLLRPETTRLLIVDIGWKGRLQVAFSSVLPHSTSIFGYYFSLEPSAEAETIKNSSSFVKWDPTVLHQSSTEWLSGYIGDRCDRFSEDGVGNIVPNFRANLDDHAPLEYNLPLKKNLSFLLRSSKIEPLPSWERIRLRLEAVTSICIFPDRLVAQCFENQSVSIATNGLDKTPMLKNAGRLPRTLGRNPEFYKSIWPACDVWSQTRRPRLAYLLQLRLWLNGKLRQNWRKCSAKLRRNDAPATS